MYVLQRIDLVTGEGDGAFVAPGGRASSYTKDLRKALKFHDRAQAERSACGNERVLTLEEAAAEAPAA